MYTKQFIEDIAQRQERKKTKSSSFDLLSHNFIHTFIIHIIHSLVATFILNRFSAFLFFSFAYSLSSLQYTHSTYLSVYCAPFYVVLYECGCLLLYTILAEKKAHNTKLIVDVERKLRFCFQQLN